MPAIKGESNKLTGLATEAEGRRVQDITVQGTDHILQWHFMRLNSSLSITLVNYETTLKLLSPMIAVLVDVFALLICSIVWIVTFFLR